MRGVFFHWLMSEMISHLPVSACFQIVTLLSALDTASIPPVCDQLTLHAGVSSSWSGLAKGTCFHSAPAAPGTSEWTNTLPSCAHVAIIDVDNPMDGAHATSRTMLPAWHLSNVSLKSNSQSSFNSHNCTLPSCPPDTSLNRDAGLKIEGRKEGRKESDDVINAARTSAYMPVGS